MDIGYLNTLNDIVETLLKDEAILKIIQDLKSKIQESSEPFLWSVINIDSLQQKLPSEIRSCWLFALKKNAPSISHYHPNSIQHTVMIEGKGRVKIGEQIKDLNIFKPNTLSIEDFWYVIDKNVPHEFFPKEEMIVISFHTCLPKELIEVSCASGEHREYEGQQNKRHKGHFIRWG